MSARSRRKGAAWQAELARRWRDAGLYPGARSTQGEQTKGARVPDVERTPFWLEAKHRKAARPVQALAQAEREAREAEDERPALAVVRPHGCGPDDAVAVMRLSTLEGLLISLGALARAVVESEAAE